MALSRSYAGIWLRAEVEPARVAIFRSTNSGRTAARVFEIAPVFVSRRLDSRIGSTREGQGASVQDTAPRRRCIEMIVALAIRQSRAIILTRCRESSSIFRASAFCDDSDLLKP